MKYIIRAPFRSYLTSYNNMMTTAATMAKLHELNLKAVAEFFVAVAAGVDDGPLGVAPRALAAVPAAPALGAT